MPTANLHELYKGVCELAGCTPASVSRDGQDAYSVRIAHVTVALIKVHDDDVVLVAEAGPMPGASALEHWLALMRANALLMDIDSPRFGRNPVTGDVTLHRLCDLAVVSVCDAYAMINQMVDLVLSWRKDPRLVGAQPTATPPTSTSSRASADFRRFHRGVCELLGQSPGAYSPAGASPENFVIDSRALGMPVTVGHEARLRPGVAFVAIRMGAPPEHCALDCAVQLMSSNFAMMDDPAGTAFCFDAARGEFVLMYTHRLAADDAPAFMEHLAAVLAIARAWRDATAKAAT
jgi:hypothetical protein